MGGEVYALSSDLVSYLATYPRPSSWTIGKEDQRVAKWMRNHPNASSIHWITERCYIYDHPKSGTTYARGFTFPDHVEQVRLEGRRGISEEERLRRGGELWQSYSTVQTWKKPYEVPASGLSIEEQVEALVEGGGRWNGQGYRSDNGRGPHAVKYDAVVFERGDTRIHGPSGRSQPDEHPDSTRTGVRPGVPDTKDTLPSARTTRFGKDLFRDPEGVAAVQLRKRSPAEGGIQEGPTRAPLGEGEYEIFNLAKGPFEDDGVYHSTQFVEGGAPKTKLTGASDSVSSASLPLSPSSPNDAGNQTREEPPVNEPTGQIRLGHHAYTVPYTEERFVPVPTLRYDPETLEVRSRRMLGLAHGGTVAVHYLKRNEWFYETALVLLGRERMWDSGLDTPAHPLDNGHSYPTTAARGGMDAVDAYELVDTPLAVAADAQVEVVPALWGSVRMHGSPIVREDGMIVEGRRAEAHREIVQSHRSIRADARDDSARDGVRWAGRFTAGGRMGMMALAEMDGVEIKVGDRSDAETTAESAPTSQEAKAEVETSSGTVDDQTSSLEPGPSLSASSSSPSSSATL